MDISVLQLVSLNQSSSMGQVSMLYGQNANEVFNE
jgi:hypothetical protein